MKMKDSFRDVQQQDIRVPERKKHRGRKFSKK
jgi:hypothetical protein